MSDDTSEIWGGRFAEGLDERVARLNASIEVDRTLALEDVAGSIAHARMLRAQGLLDDTDARSIEEGLVAIAAEVRAGRLVWDRAREDVHMNVEGALHDRIGRAAGRLHTGRSRNDQVALDLRLWLRRELTALGEDLAALVESLLDRAEREAERPMPGYTHLQRAQPVTFGHHLMAYAAMYLRDLDRVLDARRRAAVMPLGAGALATSSLPLDPERVGRELELETLPLNSLDAVSDRDPALEALSTVAIAMTHTSRLAEELVLWCSAEFGFVELPDRFCTGSSLMPQKKNPDVPELLRARTGRTFGDLQSLLAVMKSLPLAYAKDLQEDKEPLFDGVGTAREAIGLLPDLIESLRLRPERLEAALRDGFLMATDLADHLVRRGVPFREAHQAVGRAVATCLDRSCRLEDLSLDELRSLHEAFDESARGVLDPGRGLEGRSLPGGPAPDRLRRDAAEGRRRLEALRSRLDEAGPSRLEEALHTGRALPAGIE